MEEILLRFKCEDGEFFDIELDEEGTNLIAEKVVAVYIEIDGKRTLIL
jgi:hypothetical protein